MTDVAHFAAAPTVQGRTVRGLALPWSTQASDRNLMFAPGSVSWPDDGVLLRAQHAPDELPLARSPKTMQISSDDEGLQVVAEISRTSIGDDILQLIADEVIAGMSVEVALRKIDRDQAVPTVTQADLTGIALVALPAFPDAALFELDELAARRRRRRLLVAVLA